MPPAQRACWQPCPTTCARWCWRAAGCGLQAHDAARVSLQQDFEGADHPTNKPRNEMLGDQMQQPMATTHGFYKEMQRCSFCCCMVYATVCPVTAACRPFDGPAAGRCWIDYMSAALSNGVAFKQGQVLHSNRGYSAGRNLWHACVSSLWHAWVHKARPQPMWREMLPLRSSICSISSNCRDLLNFADKHLPVQ